MDHPNALSGAPGTAGEEHEAGAGRHLLLLFGIGLAVRLFALANTPILNPDGALYIHQARALWYGPWEAVHTCTVQTLSLYPLLIAGVHALVRDWVWSARLVSLVCGTLAILPAYAFLKRLFCAKTAFLATLLFALIPLFAGRSVDGIRDPLYWLFTLAGLAWIMAGLERPWLLALGSAALLLATWTRIEAFVFLPATAVFLLFSGKNGRGKRLALFLAPPVLGAALLAAAQGVAGAGEIHWHRLQDIPLRLSFALDQYDRLMDYLAGRISQAPEQNLAEYLTVSRKIVWWTALGALLTNAMESYTYAFFLLGLWGLAGSGERIRRDRRWLFPTLLGASALLVLYVYLFCNWDYDNRWMALLIMPTLAFLGSGLEAMGRWLQRRARLRPRNAAAAACAFLLLTALPQDLQPRENDKAVYREIGEAIARQETGREEIRVLTVGDAGRWISFYANLSVAGAPCPDRYHHYRAFVGRSADETMRKLRQEGIRYIVCEGPLAAGEGFAFLEGRIGKDVDLAGRWRRGETPLTLLRVR